MIEPYYQEDGITLYNAKCEDVLPQLQGVDLVMTDPPYNIGFGGYRSYADNLPDEEYVELLAQFQNLPAVVIHYPEEMARWVIPALGPFDHCSAWCYNANIRRRFRLIGYWSVTPHYERIKQAYKNQGDKRVAELIRNGSQGTELYEWWTDIQLVKNVSEEKNSHPCPVPVDLIARLIILTTEAHETILDPFAGSGTTLVAAKRLKRKAVGIELSEEYCRIAVDRLRQHEMQFDESGHST